jgi:hypothetical protein
VILGPKGGLQLIRVLALPVCLELHRTERPSGTTSVTRVRQPIFQRYVARWRDCGPTPSDPFASLPVDREGTPLAPESVAMP